MKLILFRHGTAIDREEAIQMKMEDSKRPLTEKGREKTEKMAKLLKSFEENIDGIITSPLIRAQQTAEILTKNLKIEKIQESAELVPSAPPQAFAQWLKTHAGNSTCLIAVGHEPQLSVFASWALGGQAETFIDLKKSGMLALEFASFDEITPKSAELLWLLQPRLLG
ncbi:MAG: phosphohistidine phosphatase SixA [Pseudobdellovibrionaceae bacterium]